MGPLPTMAEIEIARPVVEAAVPSTPQYRWPLLERRAGCELWVKHENHTPLGAFKVRGSVYYFHRWAQGQERPKGIVAATRGNHGQAVAFAAGRIGIPVKIFVPLGNSPEKNAAMRALGAELIESGEDFQDAMIRASALATAENLHAMPSYHRDLVCGIAVSSIDFLRAAPWLTRVYVPIGLGSGIVAMIAAREALGLKTEIIGVVAASAPATALSFAAGRVVTSPARTRIADGLASSTPQEAALQPILRGVARIVEVTDEEIEVAMRAFFTDIHQVAEGAAAAALAAVLKERPGLSERVGLVLTGGNVDAAIFARVLADCM